MMARFTALIMAMGAFAASPAWARETIELQPSSKWVLDYEEDSCVLIRQFGEGERTTYLTMRRYGPNSQLQITVSSDARFNRSDGFEYRFNHSEEWRDAYGFNVEMDNGFNGVFFQGWLEANPPGDSDIDEEDLHTVLQLGSAQSELAAAATADGIHLRSAFASDIVLVTGSLAKPIEALRTCAEDLVSFWGYDPEVQSNLSRPAKPTNFRDITRRIKYPPRMARRGTPGVLNLRLSIEADGTVSACKLQMALADPEFERFACNGIMDTAKFEPAQDNGGEAVASYYLTSVIFRMK